MHDTLLQVIFYTFAGLTVLASFLAVTQNNPVRCVLFLVVAFLMSSVLWMLLEAEFLALILVLVYVGAVMTLFLFVVMMLNIDIESKAKYILRSLPVCLVLAAVLVGFAIMSIPADMLHQSVGHMLASGTRQAPSSNTANIGMVLYTDYVYAFELAAVILLVAIVAAIMLVHRNPVRSKRQNIVQQIMTRREDRLTLISMKSQHTGHCAQQAPVVCDVQTANIQNPGKGSAQ